MQRHTSLPDKEYTRAVPCENISQGHTTCTLCDLYLLQRWKPSLPHTPHMCRWRCHLLYSRMFQYHTGHRYSGHLNFHTCRLDTLCNQWRLAPASYTRQSLCHIYTCLLNMVCMYCHHVIHTITADNILTSRTRGRRALCAIF